LVLELLGALLEGLLALLLLDAEAGAGGRVSSALVVLDGALRGVIAVDDAGGSRGPGQRRRGALRLGGAGQPACMGLLLLLLLCLLRGQGGVRLSGGTGLDVGVDAVGVG